jgi:hypothetical protein
VTNETDEPARVLMWSQSALPTVSVYPDSGKVGVWTDTPGDRFVVPRAEVGYWEGEL